MSSRSYDALLVRYRQSSLVILILAYLPAILCDAFGLPDWLFGICVLVGMALLVLLMVMTWDRLREIGARPWLFLLAIFWFDFGPVLCEASHGGFHIKQSVGGLIGWTPVFLGWFLPDRRMNEADSLRPSK